MGFRPTRDVTITGERDTYSALMAIEQWGFFKVPHILWHWTTFYNGDLRGPVTLTHNVKSLALELSLPVLTTLVCSERVSNPISCDMRVKCSTITPPRRCLESETHTSRCLIPFLTSMIIHTRILLWLKKKWNWHLIFITIYLRKEVGR